MMTLCLLLASCGAEENSLKDALAFRAVLQEHGGCTYTVNVVTEVESRGYAFSLDAATETGGLTRLTVTAPERIAGITATMTETDAVIAFDGVELDFGLLDDALTSPLYAPHVFTACWNEGYIDCAGKDGDACRVTYRLGYDEDELILETWFRRQVPVYCELYRGENLLLSGEVEAFTFLS